MPMRGQEVQRMKVGTLRTHSGILLLLFLSCGYFLTICPSAFEMQRSHALKKRKRKISALPSCINWDTRLIHLNVRWEREKKENRELQKCHFAWISLCSFLHFLVSTFWLGRASIMLLWVIPSVDQCRKSTHLSFILPADSTPQLKTPLSRCLCECQGSYSWHSTQAQLKSQFEAFWKFPFNKTTTFKQIRSKKIKHKKVKNQHIKVDV